MSRMMSTLPEELNTLTAPDTDRATVTWLGVGAPPETTLRLDAVGLGASEGNNVTKPGAVGPTAVALAAIPVAPAGIVQFPFVPVTCRTTVSPGPMGVARLPTLSGAGRVSARRHGT